MLEPRPPHASSLAATEAPEGLKRRRYVSPDVLAPVRPQVATVSCWPAVRVSFFWVVFCCALLVLVAVYTKELAGGGGSGGGGSPLPLGSGHPAVGSAHVGMSAPRWLTTAWMGTPRLGQLAQWCSETTRWSE